MASGTNEMDGAIVPIVPIVPGRVLLSYQILIPMFGRVVLVPHSIDEDPAANKCGYVVFADEPARLIQGLRFKGPEWTDSKGRNFSKPIIAWYSMEKPDGTPLFG